jgi:hypothetical protein
MACYFNEESHKGIQDNFCFIVSDISDEYKVVFQKSINTKSQYGAVAVLEVRTGSSGER